MFEYEHLAALLLTCDPHLILNENELPAKFEFSNQVKVCIRSK
jgi:hypothetical protein